MTAFYTLSRFGDQVGRSLARRRQWFAPPTAPGASGAFANLTTYAPVLSAVFRDSLNLANLEANALAPLYTIIRGASPVNYVMQLVNSGLIPEFKGAFDNGVTTPGYRTLFNAITYAQRFSIDERLFRELQNDQIRAQMVETADVVQRTIESHGAKLFNEAATTVKADGVPLVSASHPRSPSNTGTVTSNITTSALSNSTLLAARQTMMAFTDGAGLPMNVNPDTLIVPVGLANTALQLTQSQLDPTNANNTRNVNFGMNVIVSRWLTDSNNWFVVDSRMAQRFNRWFWSVEPNVAFSAESEFNLRMDYRVQMEYAVDTIGWQWIYGGTVA